MNELSIIRVITMIILAVLTIQYIAVSRIAWHRFKAGRNGLTVSVLFNSVALAFMSIAIFCFILFPIPEGIVMFSLGTVFLTNCYMIVTMWNESKRPFKKQTHIRGRLFRELEKELTDETND